MFCRLLALAPRITIAPFRAGRRERGVGDGAQAERAQHGVVRRVGGVEALAVENKPAIIVAGGSACSRQIDFARFRAIADEVDALLHDLVEQRLDDAELAAAGHDAGFVERVKRMIVGSQFKRRMPLIAKVGERTINQDFRYPRDWGA